MRSANWLLPYVLEANCYVQQLIEGDILVTDNHKIDDSKVAFYEVLENSRLNQPCRVGTDSSCPRRIIICLCCLVRVGRRYTRLPILPGYIPFVCLIRSSTTLNNQFKVFKTRGKLSIAESFNGSLVKNFPCSNLPNCHNTPVVTAP